MASSRRQLLNGQELRRTFGSGVRFGSWNVGSICERGTEFCEKLKKKKVNVCCILNVGWRGQVRFFGLEKRRYKLWLPGNDSGMDGIGILVKEELCEGVVKVRRRIDRLISMASTLSIGQRTRMSIAFCHLLWRATSVRIAISKSFLLFSKHNSGNVESFQLRWLASIAF